MPEMFTLFSTLPLLEKAPRWGRKLTNTYPLVFGYSPFGHLFVCSKDEDSFAVIVTERPELIELDVASRDEFVSRFLKDENVLSDFFCSSDYQMLSSRLGALEKSECFYPVPYPAIGGSGSLESYQRGDVWVHLDSYGQALGLA